MGFAGRAFIEKRTDIAGLHPEREAQALEARVHVGDQRDVGALDVVEDHQREPVVLLQPLEDAGDAELGIDLLRDVNDVVGVLGLQERDEAPEIGRIRCGGPIAHAR